MFMFVCIIKFIISICVLKNNINDKNINNVKKNAVNCGSIGIKILQAFVMNDFFKTDKLNFALENCPEHEYEFTEKIYFDVYNKDISEKYIYKELLGTGSIGQVYKMYDYENGRWVAIKVKHPDVEKKIKQFVFITKFLKFIFRIPIFKLILDYTENINLQLDYTLEAKNTIKLKEKFKNENCIVFPEIYEYNNNFIIMEYLEGQTFNEIPSSSKSKISMYINYFMLTSILIHDFTHSDLHNGNWKIQLINGETKIIIYDCGLVCSTGDIELNRKIIKYTLNNNYRKLLTFILKDKLKNNPKLHLKIENCIYNCNLDKQASSHERLETFIKKSISEGFFDCNCRALVILNSFVIVNKIASVGVNDLCKYVYIKKDLSVSIIMNIHVEILKKLNIFNDLCSYFSSWLDKNQSNAFLYKAWLINEFGHDSSKIFIDIIYKHMFLN